MRLHRVGNEEGREGDHAGHDRSDPHTPSGDVDVLVNAGRFVHASRIPLTMPRGNAGPQGRG